MATVGVVSTVAALAIVVAVPIANAAVTTAAAARGFRTNMISSTSFSGERTRPPPVDFGRGYSHCPGHGVLSALPRGTVSAVPSGPQQRRRSVQAATVMRIRPHVVFM
jgi:hypothetical protein